MGSKDHYRSVFEKVQKSFPEADVVASAFEDWLDAVDSSGLREAPPAADAEMGDARICGVPSDPKQTARARALDAALTRYLAAGGERDAEYKELHTTSNH